MRHAEPGQLFSQFLGLSSPIPRSKELWDQFWFIHQLHAPVFQPGTVGVSGDVAVRDAMSGENRHRLISITTIWWETVNLGSWCKVLGSAWNDRLSSRPIRAIPPKICDQTPDGMLSQDVSVSHLLESAQINAFAALLKKNRAGEAGSGGCQVFDSGEKPEIIVWDVGKSSVLSLEEIGKECVRALAVDPLDGIGNVTQGAGPKVITIV